MPRKKSPPKIDLLRKRRRERVSFAARVRLERDIVQRIRRPADHYMIAERIAEQACREFGIFGKTRKKVMADMTQIEITRPTKAHALIRMTPEQIKEIRIRTVERLMRTLGETYSPFMDRVDQLRHHVKKHTQIRRKEAIMTNALIEMPETRHKRIRRKKNDTTEARRLFDECAREFGIFGKTRRQLYALVQAFETRYTHYKIAMNQKPSKFTQEILIETKAAKKLIHDFLGDKTEAFMNRLMEMRQEFHDDH